ncbi:MAG: hypothetical protein WD850_00505 [Candidatus Spechtbacterales bacterium]
MDILTVSIPAAMWVGLAAFMVAALVELSMRGRAIRAQQHAKALPSRIDKGLARLRAERPERITNDWWEHELRVSDSTAARDLNKLVELGILQKIGRGRGVHYRRVHQRTGQTL